MKWSCTAAVAAALIVSAVDSTSAASLALDFQPVGGMTAPGFVAFEQANANLPVAGGINYPAFNTTVNVTLEAANLPDGAPDFRAVARNGTANESVKDWIGVDTRTGGTDVTLTVKVSGLPVGLYSWLSEHHDGASDSTNGNLHGAADIVFVDASGTTNALQKLSSSQIDEPISTYSKIFTSDGVNPISFSLIMDNGQGFDANDTDTVNHLFAFINSAVITEVPEPGSLGLACLALAGLVARRRRD